MWNGCSAAGIASVNVDLIAGLPYQTMASWEESLKTLAATGANHASLYMLEVDEDSRLGRELLAEGGRYHAASVPTDDAMADMYLAGIDYLGGQGIAQYEISNFAREGAESRHNLKYWQRAAYLGLGVDAHSMLVGRDGHTIRLATSENLDDFLENPRDPVRSPPERSGATGRGVVPGAAADERRESHVPWPASMVGRPLRHFARGSTRWWRRGCWKRTEAGCG